MRRRRHLPYAVPDRRLPHAVHDPRRLRAGRGALRPVRPTGAGRGGLCQRCETAATRTAGHGSPRRAAHLVLALHITHEYLTQEPDCPPEVWGKAPPVPARAHPHPSPQPE